MLTSLYIPLRSDKTPHASVAVVVRCFFISHYVQIKPGSAPAPPCRAENLYIPLRSDKTVSPSCEKDGASIFISHYVQIKLWTRGTMILSCACFISHYVQIKRSAARHRDVDDPHFISHYVQIKPPRSEKLSMTRYTLYPTTFR